jgi:hypothetical protein
MIEVWQHMGSGSRSSTGSAWRATATTHGQMYEATGRHGAPQALARVLVAAAIANGVGMRATLADQPVTVTTEDVPGKMIYRSLHGMAKWTFAEGNLPLRRARWQPRPDNIAAAVHGDAENRGESVPEAAEDG